jgi:hypothetical protein
MQHPEQDSTQNWGKREDPDLSSKHANPDSDSGGFHDQSLVQVPQTTEIVQAQPHDFRGPKQNQVPLVGGSSFTA